MSTRPRRALGLVAFGVAAGAVLAPHALAEGLTIRFQNQLAPNPAFPGYPKIAFRSSGDLEKCWDRGELAGDPRATGPGETNALVTNRSACFKSDPYTRADIYLKETPSSEWVSPFEKSFMTIHDRNARFGSWFEFRDSLAEWVPRRLPRMGLMCWDAKWSDEYHVIMRVMGDARCNQAVPGRTSSDVGSSRPDQPSGSGRRITAKQDSSSRRRVVDVLTMAQTACEWVEGSDCGNVGKEGEWEIGNLTYDVRDFQFTGMLADPAAERKEVGTASINSTGTLSVTRSVQYTEARATATTVGAKLGGKIVFKKTPGGGAPPPPTPDRTSVNTEGGGGASQTPSPTAEKVNLDPNPEMSLDMEPGPLTSAAREKGLDAGEISAELSWSETKTVSQGTNQTVAVSVSTNGQEGYETLLTVFALKRTTKFTYTGDLDFGVLNAEQNTTTPLLRGLGVSPELRHPCLGYAVGDTRVRRSLMQIAQSKRDSGYDPYDSSLPADRRALMTGIAGFVANGTCPGFPAGFASRASFRGSGVGAKGVYDKFNVNGVDLSIALVGCVYRSPLRTAAKQRTPQLPDAAIAQGGGPCGAPDAAGQLTVSAPGAYLDRSRAVAQVGAPVVTTGGDGSELVNGSSARDVISLGGGDYDIAKGNGGDDVIRGGDGRDLIDGGDGNDRIDAGRDRDEVHGDAGDDIIRDSGGDGSLDGDAGNDTLIVRNFRGTVEGGAGRDTIEAHGDLRAVGMGGGPGNDTYRVTGSGPLTIVEFPGEGNADRLESERSVKVPVNVEITRLTGSRPANVTADEGSQTLLGNSAANRLVGGRDRDVMVGGGGNDTLVFDPWAFDVATGGPGADRFVPQGQPARFEASGPGPRRPRAPRITDLRPDEGDRVVMSAAAMGPEIRGLRTGRVVIREGVNPRPTTTAPTLLFDSRWGLVRFDRDGTGPIMAKVVVELPGTTRLPREAFVVAR